jgi:hypothetical protein
VTARGRQHGNETELIREPDRLVVDTGREGSQAVDLAGRRDREERTLHRDLGSGEAEAVSQLRDPGPGRAPGREDHGDAGGRDGLDRVADGGSKDAALVEDGSVDVAGEEARARQARGRRPGEGFDGRAPFGWGVPRWAGLATGDRLASSVVSAAGRWWPGWVSGA